MAETIYATIVLTALFTITWFKEERPSALKVAALVLTVAISFAIGWTLTK